MIILLKLKVTLRGMWWGGTGVLPSSLRWDSEISLPQVSFFLYRSHRTVLYFNCPDILLPQFRIFCERDRLSYQIEDRKRLEIRQTEPFSQQIPEHLDLDSGSKVQNKKFLFESTQS